MLKHLLFSVTFSVFSFCSLQGQVLFSENFDAGWPSGFLLYNEDGLTPDDPDLIGLADSAWSIRYIAQNAWNSDAAFSVSWYEDDQGPSDDWMVLPSVDVLENTVLFWTAQAITSSGDFRDRYQVAISTDGPDIEDFEQNPLLFDTGEIGEADSLRFRSVNLADAGYMNQTVYIAFRNFTAPYDPGQPTGPGNGGNELMIDDIRIENNPSNVKVVSNDHFRLNVSPNPATDHFQVNFNLSQRESVQLSLLDQMGKEVMAVSRQDLMSGQQQVQFPVSQVPNGVYILQIRTADKISAQKVLIQR
jgi:hypothetical protein